MIPSVLQAASYLGRRAHHHHHSPSKPRLGYQIAQKYSQARSGAASPSPAAPGRGTRPCSPKTSKPVRRRRVDKPTLSRMTKTQFLTPALSRRTAGIAPARFVDTRGPLVPAARAGPCGAADGARGASHGYPSEFKVRRGRSCGCSIMRSDGTHVLLKSFRQTCSS